MIAQNLRWLRTFPRRKKLRRIAALWLAAVLLPFAPAYYFLARGMHPAGPIALTCLYEALLLSGILMMVGIPPLKALYTTAAENHVLSPNSETLRAAAEDIAAYIRNNEKKQDRVQLLQKQAELDALQSQINPHFLYNTLDTIRGQALEEGCHIAPDMLGALSTLLRYTISYRDDIVPLRQELRSIDNYMKLQQLRFNHRFKYVTKIDDNADELLAYTLPKLTLQPLVENAIFHGIEPLLGGGVISVEVYSTQSRLVVNIRDNGVGMDEEQLRILRDKLSSASLTPLSGVSSRRGTGLALMNVNARIQLAYGQQFGLLVFSTKGIGTQFQVTLPIMEDWYENGSPAH